MRKDGAPPPPTSQADPSVSLEDNWLVPYLSTEQSKDNGNGYVKSGKRLSSTQREHNVRRRSLASLRDDAAVAPEEQLPGGGDSAAPSPPSPPRATRMSTKRRSSSSDARAASDAEEAAARCAPLFKRWAAGATVAAEGAQHGCVESGDLEALRARLVGATEMWADAAEVVGRISSEMPEAVRVAMAAQAADLLIATQFHAAAAREARSSLVPKSAPVLGSSAKAAPASPLAPAPSDDGVEHGKEEKKAKKLSLFRRWFRAA